MSNSQRLLPVGFYDLLFDEAKENHRKINFIIDGFLEANYNLIKTPLLEFADNFSHEQNANSFFVSDIISGKNLVLRNDITPQISRLLEGRLKNYPLPLKLCYVGDVLLAKNSELYADRQSTQVGLEIIGDNSEDSNFEIIGLTLETLLRLDLEDLLIEFSLPNFAEMIIQDLFGNAQFEKEELLAAIAKKDLSAIKIFGGKYADLINEIALSSDDIENLSHKIISQTKSSEIKKELERAKKISTYIRKYFTEIQPTFDLFGSKDSYHQDISFSVFTKNFAYPIVKGGRYQINGLEAVGATIYMNYLRKI